jgi:hypothetical protein
VVTGSRSIITVPVMFQAGIEARGAVATNMFALTFMSLGGSLPFLPPSAPARRRLPLLIIITLIGSTTGAFLLTVTPSRIVPLIVPICCHWLAIFSMVYRRSGVNPSDVAPSRGVEVTGYVLTFLLGTYGGLFSERLRHTPYGAFCGDVPHDFYRGHRNHEADQCFFFGDCDSDFHAAWTGRLSTRCHSGSDDICGRATRSPFRPPPGEFVDPAHSFRGRLVVGAGDTSLRCVGLRHPPCETAHCSIVGCRDGYARVICATRPRLRPGARARPTKTYQYADKAEAIQKKCIKLDATLAVIMEFARGRAVLRPPSPSLARRAPPVRSPVQPLSRVPENRRRR